MALRAEYDSLEDVPEVHRELYGERGGKYVVTGIDGIKTQADVDRVLEGAKKEREEHKATKARFGAWSSLRSHEGTPFEKPEDVQALLDQFPTLKLAADAGGSKSAEVVKAQVEAEAKRLEAKYGKQLSERDTKYTAAEQRIQRLENTQRKTFVEQYVQKAVAESKIGKIKPGAIEDVLMYAERHLVPIEERDDDGNLVFKDVRTKSNAGVTEDVDVNAWLSEMQGRKSHWYEESEGGGSGPKGRGGPGGGVNPWAKGSWDVTAQGAYFRAHGAERAAARAKEAGSFLGAPSAPIK